MGTLRIDAISTCEADPEQFSTVQSFCEAAVSTCWNDANNDAHGRALDQPWGLWDHDDDEYTAKIYGCIFHTYTCTEPCVGVLNPTTQSCADSTPACGGDCGGGMMCRAMASDPNTCVCKSGGGGCPGGTIYECRSGSGGGWNCPGGGLDCEGSDQSCWACCRTGDPKPPTLIAPADLHSYALGEEIDLQSFLV